jgi:Transposase DDE domain
MFMPPPRSAVAIARKRHNARVATVVSLISTSTSQPGSGRKSGRRRRSSCKHKGRGAKWEALFAELKNQIGLRRLRLRRLRFIREQFYLAATVQNLKRLVRFLSRKSLPEIATA